MDAEFALTSGFRNDLENWADFNAAALLFFCKKKECIFVSSFSLLLPDNYKLFQYDLDRVD